MVKRSLNTTIEGAERAKRALEYCGLTQQALAEELLIGRATISKFFNCHNVDRNYFLEICHKLELDWQEIFERPSIEEKKHSFFADEGEIDSSALVIQSEPEKHVNDNKDLDDSSVWEFGNSGVKRQVLLDEVEITGTIETEDLIQKARLGSSVTQKMATNLKAENVKLGNLTQEC